MGTFGAIGIAGSGLGTYRKWLDAVSDNLANLNTVRSTDETAFQARYIVAQANDTQGGGQRRRPRRGRRLRLRPRASRLRTQPPSRRRGGLRSLPRHRHGEPDDPIDHGPARLPGERLGG